MGLWKQCGLVAALATVGLPGAVCRAADPAAPAGTTAPGATNTPLPPADAAAIPGRPQTADEKALQMYLDTIQGQMAAAVTAEHPEDYGTALDRLAAAKCRFYAVGGQEASRTKYLGVERAAIAAQGPGLKETWMTQKVTITGTTALANSIAIADQDVTDTTGQFGPKGHSHHWQRQTFYRIHLAGTAGRSNDWKAQQVAITNIQTYLDGNPYAPPMAATTQKRTAKAKTTRKPRAYRPRPPRYIIVGPGMVIRR